MTAFADFVETFTLGAFAGTFPGTSTSATFAFGAAAVGAFAGTFRLGASAFWASVADFAEEVLVVPAMDVLW